MQKAKSGALSALTKLKQRFTPRTKSGSLSREQHIKLLTQSVVQCGLILDVFSSAVLLLDEVDLVLHPLKSELNWPLGPRIALDLTTGERAVGQRWCLPFFLLDAFFFVFTGIATC